MSWTGTVRCTICYKEGHNKSGCPQVKADYEQFKDLVTKYNVANPDEPDIKVANQYMSWEQMEKTGVSYRHLRAAKIVETKKRKNKTRQCTYCGEVGHNRQTCKPLKSDIDLLVKASMAYNKRLAKAYELSGFHVGSLVQHKSEEYDYSKGEYIKETVMGVITDIGLPTYDVMKWLTQDWQQHRSIKIQGSNGKTYLLRPELPSNIKSELFVGYAWSSAETNYTILSSKDTPVPPHAFDVKEHRKYIKGYLKDLKKRNVESNSNRIAALIGGDS